MARTKAASLEEARPLIEALQGPIQALGLDAETTEAMFEEFFALRDSCLREVMN
jgi:hypothetical protein